MKGMEHADRIIEIYQSGKSIKETADKISFEVKTESYSDRLIKKILEAKGIKLRKTKAKSPFGQKRRLQNCK